MKKILLTLFFLIMLTGCSNAISSTNNNYMIRVLERIDIDLDNDGGLEKIEILEYKYDDGRIEGRLKISNNENIEKIFIQKANNLTGVYQHLDIQNLDNDAEKEILIVIPDIGNNYTLNYFYVYDYKENKSLIFDYDYSIKMLSNFLKGFKFKYLAQNKVEIINKDLNYKQNLYIDEPGQPIPDDGKYQDNTATAIPVAIKDEENNKFIASVEIVDNQIRIPLLLSAMNYKDIIAEIDVYAALDKNSNLELTKYEIYEVSQIGGYNKTKISENKLK